jgi:hypothetical protein
MSYQASGYGHFAEVRPGVTVYESTRTSSASAVAFTALPQAALVINAFKYAHMRQIVMLQCSMIGMQI